MVRLLLVEMPNISTHLMLCLILCMKITMGEVLAALQPLQCSHSKPETTGQAGLTAVSTTPQLMAS